MDETVYAILQQIAALPVHTYKETHEIPNDGNDCRAYVSHIVSCKSCMQAKKLAQQALAQQALTQRDPT